MIFNENEWNKKMILNQTEWNKNNPEQQFANCAKYDPELQFVIFPPKKMWEKKHDNVATLDWFKLGGKWKIGAYLRNGVTGDNNRTESSMTTIGAHPTCVSWLIGKTHFLTLVSIGPWTKNKLSALWISKIWFLWNGILATNALAWPERLWNLLQLLPSSISLHLKRRIRTSCWGVSSFSMTQQLELGHLYSHVGNWEELSNCHLWRPPWAGKCGGKNSRNRILGTHCLYGTTDVGLNRFSCCVLLGYFTVRLTVSVYPPPLTVSFLWIFFVF